VSSVINHVTFADPLSPSLEARFRETPRVLNGDAPIVGIGRFLDARGLAPPQASRPRFIVGCVYNSSGLGLRRLTDYELAALKDVPILLLDFLRKRGGSCDLQLVRTMAQGHPSKVLHMGADYLLSVFDRGGYAPSSRQLIGRSRSVSQGSFGSTLPNSSQIAFIRRALELAMTEELDDDEILGEAVSSAEIRTKEGQKEDDSPIHFHIWDLMFLRSWATIFPGGERFSLVDTWNDPRKCITIHPCSNAEDRLYSDTQLSCPVQLPRWRWSLFKIRAAALRYWRRETARSFHRYIRTFLSGASTIAEDVPSNTCVRPKNLSLPRKRKRDLEPQRQYQVTEYQWEGWSPGMKRGTSKGELEYQQFWRRRNCHSSELTRSLEIGRDCIRRTSNALWWDWNAGSALLFWKWPSSHMKWARDGQPHFIIGDLPKFTRPQRVADTPKLMELMRKKVNKVRERTYIEVGEVKSLTHMFAVPKGEADIRMVYNGTSSGLNDVIFAPHFGLPTTANTFRSLLLGYYQADLDVAEMFLCFPLGMELRPYAGVDVTLIRTRGAAAAKWEVERMRLWERWARNFMGLRDSPYRSLQLMLMAKQLSYGKRTDPNNPFAWERVVLNLPGSETYDPSLPWVMKIRSDGHLACEVYVYVDDGRITGWCKMECWRAARRFSSVISSLGIQDAYRKRTEALREQGTWIGGVTLTTPPAILTEEEGRSFQVSVTVTQMKWVKIQGLVEELHEMISTHPDALDRERLEQIRGFLNYAARTYRWLNTYLKGLHLTIDGWRPDRDPEGYRIRAVGKPGEDTEDHPEFGEGNLKTNESAIRQAERDFEAGKELDLDAYRVRPYADVPAGAPRTVKAVPRLKGDVETLLEFVKGDAPAIQKCRVSTVAVALYLMGDASGAGFGSALWDNEGVEYEAGNWKQHWEEESSNFREASNLTARIEKLGNDGTLHDKELFVFTDNSSYEGTFYKGHSKTSAKLTELIRRLRVLERKFGCIIHVIHIAGTRMKFSGVDGLSRGDLLEGIMSGSNPWDFIPLNTNANERTGGRVETWVRSWWFDRWGTPWTGTGGDPTLYESSELVTLSPTSWFSLRDIRGHRLWMPPPAAMETIVEVFNEDRIVNPHLAHVFAIPRLMTHLWRKHLFRDADVRFYVQAGAPFWPSTMHEPLTVIIVFPLAHVESYRGPWVVKDLPKAREFGERMDSEFGRPREHGRREFSDLEEPMPSMWEDECRWTRDFLFEFLQAQSTFPPVQGGLLRGMLPSLRGRPLPGTKGVGGRG